MKIEAPCRLGQRFHCEKPYSKGRFALTGLSFFYWDSSRFPGTTLCGKREPENRLENSTFFEPGDTEEGVRISFEVPDAIVIPGYPLSELGMDTKAVGHLTGLTLQEDGWAFYIPTEGTTEARWSPYGRRPWTGCLIRCCLSTRCR